MSKYISTYQVRQHTCRHKHQYNDYVNIPMVCQYEYEHTKYGSIYISIPSMSKHISTLLVCRYKYEHTSYVDTYFKQISTYQLNYNVMISIYQIVMKRKVFQHTIMIKNLNH